MNIRQQIICAVFRLFYRQGFSSVSIDRISQETEISDTTLYQHLSSKEQLLLAVLDYRYNSFMKWLQSRMEEAGGRVASIDALFAALDDWFNNRAVALAHFNGCFFTNISAEFNDIDTDVGIACAQHKVRVAGLIHHYVQQLQLSEEQTDTLAHTLTLLKEGTIVTARVQGDMQAAIRAGGIAKIILASYCD